MRTSCDNRQQNKKSEHLLSHSQNNFDSIPGKYSKISETLLSLNKSSQSPESVPFITLPGATKRKSSGTSSSFNMNLDNSFIFDGPIPKQKRYEDNMSSKLDNIHIEDNGQQNKGIQKKPISTTCSSSGQISRPKIVEIVDWDSELLDQETSLPIIEEPKEEKVLEQEKQINEKASEEYYDFEDIDDEDLENEYESQKIILSDKLRKFISNGIEGNFALLQKPKTKIIGNELVLFVQPSLSSILKNISKPQIEEVNEEQNNNIMAINDNNLLEFRYLEMESSTTFNSPLILQEEENYLKNGDNVEEEEEMDIG